MIDDNVDFYKVAYTFEFFFFKTNPSIMYASFCILNASVAKKHISHKQ